VNGGLATKTMASTAFFRSILITDHRSPMENSSMTEVLRLLVGPFLTVLICSIPFVITQLDQIDMFVQKPSCRGSLKK
jgi:hypothetical protein